MRLSGKTAFITGGTSGIGLATAKAFLAEGARVAITGRSRAKLERATAELGPDVVALVADVTDIASLERAVAAAAERFGHLDIVFANAGIGGATPLGQTTAEAWNAVIATNLTGVFFTVQAALPHLTEGASVILNGSVHAVLGIPGWAAYAATKGAVRTLTRNLAAELAPRRVRVNQVTPGATRTPIWAGAAPTADALAALEAQLGATAATGRMSEPEEIAAAVVFLASDAAANVTAQEIVVDGGATGAPYGAPVFAR
jgi:NAD(P)-dependent dehydrogenase (short-subunit alcohol dehydrogenase family)